MIILRLRYVAIDCVYMKLIDSIVDVHRVHRCLVEDVIKGKPFVKRSARWEEVRRKHLLDNPVCVACGCSNGVQVHHLRPFHLFPELELEPSNLITLCENEVSGGIDNNHHLVLGHRGNFKNNNINVLTDINDYRVNKSHLGQLTGYDMVALKRLL